MPELKNQTFINNITDPKTGKQVKKIYQMKISKIGRLVEPMVWEYYKNRANMSISDIYKKYKGYQLKMIFFGDPIIYTVNTLDINELHMDTIPRNSTFKKLLEKIEEKEDDKINIEPIIESVDNLTLESKDNNKEIDL
jgi:hypothetical protein